jgi:predicted nuclease of predicted toxin-antitoxin system
MKLLFDHHLSHKLVQRLADLFPDSTQTRLLGMATTQDQAIWEYARQHGFILVSLDADFYDMSLLRGHPPKLIWLRCGNSTVAQVEHLLRDNFQRVELFAADPATGCLEIL